MSNPLSTNLYDQFVGADSAGGEGQTWDSENWPYVGSLPFSDTTPVVGPKPPPATVPYWDVPPVSLDPSDASPSPWDTLFLGGQQFPGIARVKSKKHKRIDVKKKKGDSSATMTFVGYGPADIEITLSIWSENQFNFLQTLMPMLLPKPVRPGVATNFSPIDISYPSLILAGIRSVIVAAVDTLEPATPKGVWNMKIHCLEYYQPTKSDQTATASSSSAYTANTAIKQGAPKQIDSIPKPSQTQSDVGPRNVTFR